MRTAMKFALTMVVAACLSVPLTLMAQNQVTTASLAGRSVDAAGRGVIGERVELLIGTDVVNSVMTNGLGEWSFKGVQPGVYVLRMNVRGRVAGIRVTVAAGQVVSGTMIVVPAATASMQFGTFANLLTLIPTATTAAVTTVTTTVQEVETVEISPAILVQILSALPEADRKVWAAAVVAAVQNEVVGAAPFVQYVAEIQAVAATGVVPPAATFTPPANVS